MRGEGETFWIIVAAALALIVLVVLSMIVWKGSSGASAETGCEARGGKCVSQGSCPKGASSAFFSCSEKDEVCCLSSIV